MALLKANGQIIAKWFRGAKAKSEGSALGQKFVHWEPPKIRSNDRSLITPSDDGERNYEEKRKFDLIRGKFKG
jgi:hypothetical protein